MDGSLKAVEPWLPAEFSRTEFGSAFKPGFAFPTEFPYEFDSAGSSSPDESVVGSAETESSEDDDFLAGLTRRLAEKKWVMAGSPESTLSGLGSWSASSNSSPNGVLSPPTTPFGAKNDTWDLIYAAAGQVAKLKLNNEGNMNSKHGRGSMTPLKLQNPAAELKNQNTQFFSGHNSSTHLNQYERVARNEQMLKRGISPAWEKQPVRVSWQAQPQLLQNRNRGIAGSCANGGRLVRPVALPNSAWPSVQVPEKQPPQQQPGAVFLNGSGVKKERAGTGVFLPRRYDNPALIEAKKKPACSTAYLPPRVVQALNLNLDDLNSSYDAMMARGNAVVALQQRRNLRHDNVLTHHEVRLPRDWTY